MKITKRIIPVIIAIGLILTAADWAFADPTITNVSTDLNTISGNGFGTGGATNITWDDFEDGTVSTTATVGTWGSVNVLGASSESRNSNSAYAAHHNFTTEATAGVRCINSVLSQKWFIQYWVKLDSFDWGTGQYGSNNQFLTNVKFLRLWNPSDSATEDFFTQFGWGLNEMCYSNNEGIGGQFDYYNDTSFSKSTLSDGAWHCLQFEFKDSSAPNVADSTFKVWHNGTLIESRAGIINRTNSLLKRPFFIGFYNALNPNTRLGETDRSPNHYYMDDVYAAPTLARVELGNAPTYDACTHREIQVPSAWSDTSITITPNKGSFSDSDNVYLFVVDPNGVTSAGYGPIRLSADQAWFTDSFEGTGTQGWDPLWREFGTTPPNTHITTDEIGGAPGAGTKAYRQSWTSGGTTGMIILDFNRVPGMPALLGTGDDFHFSYYLFYDPSFDWHQTNWQEIKHVILESTHDSSNDRMYVTQCDANSAVRVFFQGVNVPDEWGTLRYESYYSNVNGGRYAMPKGQWVRFDWYVKVSPESEGQGILKGWVNGVLRWDYSDIATIQSGSYYQIYLDYVMNERINGPNQKRYWDLFSISSGNQGKPGDVNGDGVVNVLDLILVAKAFGTQDLRYDLNNNGTVDVGDIIFVARHFGE